MTELLASTLRLSTPLLFAAMGGLLCERAGIATICLEGVMITSAWTAAVVNYYSHDPWMAVLAAMFAGAFTMLLHALLSLTARADHIVSGVAVNIIAAGITPLLNKVLFGSPTNSAAIPMGDRLSVWPIPVLSQIPLFGKVFFEQPPLIYLGMLLPLIIHWVYHHTRPGLRLRASGDGPEALLTAGVSPERVRYLALIAGGALASFGGTYLSISHASQFTRDMTAGRGFIALTAVIFGNWKPVPTAFACLLFGFADAVQIHLQGTTLFGLALPVQFIQAIPYVVTLVVLAGFIGKSVAPLSLGKRCPSTFQLKR